MHYTIRCFSRCEAFGNVERGSNSKTRSGPQIVKARSGSPLVSKRNSRHQCCTTISALCQLHPLCTNLSIPPSTVLPKGTVTTKKSIKRRLGAITISQLHLYQKIYEENRLRTWTLIMFNPSPRNFLKNPRLPKELTLSITISAIGISKN